MILPLMLALQVAGVQPIPQVKLDALERRFSSGSDTTYIVNFWATWCKPCVSELPAFDKLNRTMQGQPIKVLLVSLDDPRENRKVATFIKKQGFTTEVVLLDEDKPHLWIDRVSESWSGAIPATLMVNTGAVQRSFHEGELSYDTLAATLDTFLKGLP